MAESKVKAMMRARESASSVEATSNTETKQHPGVAEKARLFFRPYEVVYDEYLNLTPEVQREEHPEITDYEWICYNWYISEKESASAEDEKIYNKVAQALGNSSAGSSKLSASAVASKITKGVTAAVTPIVTVVGNKASNNAANNSASDMITIPKAELESIVNKAMDTTKNDILRMLNR